MSSASSPLLHVVLLQPDIPPNTGNIGRTCVAVGAKLWLVRPLGFRLDEKHLRRAGMDYWPLLTWEAVDHWHELLQRLALTEAGEPRRFWFIEECGTKLVWEAPLSPGDVFVFGSETRGIPPSLLAEHADRILKLPMLPGIRSLNLASTATAVIYEALRQFGGLPEQ